MVGTTEELPKNPDGVAPTENKNSAPVYDLSMMKKKKKKKPKSDSAEAGSELAASVAALGSGGVTDLPAIGEIDLNANPETEEAVVDFPPPDFTQPKKRWRKPKVVFDDEEVSTRVVRRAKVVQPWDGTTRDYTYSELINRAFNFLHGKNPALAAEGGRGKKKISLQLPQVAREGTKKTVFMNFGAICKSIHRQQDHLLQYMSAELGTTGNIQDGGRLVIKGRFTGESIVKVLKRYMSEYVICTSCRSPDTVLMRDANTRLYFVSCESCGAKRSVAPIRQGFMAQVERRKRT